MKPFLLSLLRALMVLSAVASGLVLTLGVGGAPAGASQPTLDPTLDIVGGPVAAGNVAVVIAVVGNKHLVMAGIDPTSGHIIWQHPYSMSDITAGVGPMPAAIGTTVVDLVPSGKATNPIVNVDGVNATTGAVLWSDQKLDMSDVPQPCPGNTLFCIIGFNPDGSSTLAALQPSTGEVVNILNGPNRAFAVGLYETDANAPTLQAISSVAKPIWTKTVTSLFGTGYDPNYGWDMTIVGGEVYGTVSHKPAGGKYVLDDEKTIGVNPLAGTTEWSTPGFYQCEGPLSFLSTPTVCRYHGTVSENASPAQVARETSLELAGFNPATGSVTWTQAVRNQVGYESGTGVPFLDGTSMVVTLPSGALTVLNTQTGVTSAVTKGEVFWCVNTPFFNSGSSKDVTSDGQRVSSPDYYGCTANGKTAGHAPSTTPSAAGTLVDGVFLWPTSHGLGAHVVAPVQA